MTIIEISLLVLILAAIALCIYLILSLKKLNHSVEILQKDVHGLYEKTVPLIENLTEITDRASKVTSEAEAYWNDITESIQSIKAKISSFGRSSGLHSSGHSIEDFIKNFKAIFKGISAFWENIRK